MLDVGSVVAESRVFGRFPIVPLRRPVTAVTDVSTFLYHSMDTWSIQQFRLLCCEPCQREAQRVSRLCDGDHSFIVNLSYILLRRSLTLLTLVNFLMTKNTMSSKRPTNALR